MDDGFWARACKAATSQPVDATIMANTISSSVTVRAPNRCSLNLHTTKCQPDGPTLGLSLLCIQVAAFIAASLVSSLWLFRWCRLRARKKEFLDRVWRHLGSFTSLLFVGSIVGVLAWSANIPSLTFYYNARDPKLSAKNQARNVLLLLSSHATWIAVFLVAQSLETFCLSLAKMMMLGRLIKHVQGASNLTLARRTM